MRFGRVFAVAMIAVAVGAACGQPNGSDTPGANGLGAAPPTPSPTAIATAAAVTTPCTKGQTKIIPGGERVNDSKCGTGAEATRGSSIKVKYVGKLSSGKVFDSSAKHGGKPYSTRIGVGAAIPGLDEGVPGMRVGGVRNLLIPPALAFGSSGAGSIPPNATIEFTIKLLAVSQG